MKNLNLPCRIASPFKLSMRGAVPTTDRSREAVPAHLASDPVRLKACPLPAERVDAFTVKRIVYNCQKQG